MLHQAQRIELGGVLDQAASVEAVDDHHVDRHGPLLAGLPGAGTSAGADGTFSGFPADSKITGRLTIGGKAPTSALEVGFHPTAIVAVSTAATVKTDAGGYFAVNAKPAEFKDYSVFQFNFDDQNGTQSADPTVMGLFAFGQVGWDTASADLKVPQAKADLKWDAAASPAADATWSGSDKFTFKPIPDGNYKYGVAVLRDDTSKSQCWTSTYSSKEVAVAWDGKCSSGAQIGAGTAFYYQVRFSAKTASFGAGEFGKALNDYGATKYIKLKMPS